MTTAELLTLISLVRPQELEPFHVSLAQFTEHSASNGVDAGENLAADTTVSEPDKRAGTVLKTECTARCWGQDLH